MRFDINKLHVAIDRWSMQMPEENINIHIPANSEKERTHLGLSVLSDDCQRKVFYNFRRVANKSFPPRMLRLFQRGHREEFFFMHMLRSVGLKIYEVDPKTGKQFKVSDFEGHLGGSMDGIARDKKLRYVDEDHPFKLEFKTYNSKRFDEMEKKEVRQSDPKYYGQVQGYLGYEPRLKGALFCAVCKDDDRLHFEWILPDPSTFDMIRERAELIINSKTPPEGITKSKSFWKCKFCDFRGNCFDAKPSVKSCRSCVHASPAPNKEWVCDKGHTFGKPCKEWEDCNQ